MTTARSSRRPVQRAKAALVPGPLQGRLLGADIGQSAMTDSATDRRRPDAVDFDEARARELQPPQHALGLFSCGGGGRPRPWPYRLGGEDERGYERTRRRPARRDARGGEPAIADDGELPPALRCRSSGDHLGARSEGGQTLHSHRPSEEGREALALAGGLLEPLHG